MRTKAQQRWNLKGIRYEMIPMRPQHKGAPRYSYVLGAHESWRAQRKLGHMLGMPVRPICKQFIHNGRKP